MNVIINSTQYLSPGGSTTMLSPWCQSLVMKMKRWSRWCRSADERRRFWRAF